MATANKFYVSLHPGQVGRLPIRAYHIPPEDNNGDEYLAVSMAGHLMLKNTFPWVGGFMPYTAAQWTVTSTGTGAAQAQATTAGGGILLTTGSTSTFYSGLQSKAVVTPASGKVFSCVCRVQLSHATQIGYNIGFANAQAAPTATEYTDFFGFRKAPGTAECRPTVIGNGGAVTQIASIGTPVAATEFELGFFINLNATAGSVDGAWYLNGTRTDMTSTMATQAALILTTPPTDWGLTLFATGTTGNNPTMTVTSCIAEVDN